MTRTQDIIEDIRRLNRSLRPRLRTVPSRTGPLQCRVCLKRAQVQLTHADTDAYEMLCLEHLGEFIATWADPRVREWIVVRL